ncbi:hypothetical protein Hanom_Chr02g00149801 [Helianthus anomalus]
MAPRILIITLRSHSTLTPLSHFRLPITNFTITTTYSPSSSISKIHSSIEGGS